MQLPAAFTHSWYERFSRSAPESGRLFGIRGLNYQLCVLSQVNRGGLHNVIKARLTNVNL